MSKVWRDHGKTPPDEFELCLVLDYNGDYYLAWYRDEYWFEYMDEQIVDVKYWSRLPVPPNE